MAASGSFFDDFLEFLRKLIEDFDKEKIRKEVEELKARFPSKSNEELSQRLINDASVVCAIVGAGTGALPGPWTFIGIAPDITTLLMKQSCMVLKIAMIYGYDPDGGERAAEVLGCIGCAGGAVAGAQGIRPLVKAGLKSKLAKEIAKKIGVVLGRRLVAKIVPVVGGLVGGGLNYAGVQVVGKVAAKYYKKKGEPHVE